VDAPESVLATTVEKGSIAIDGISLTVARLLGNGFVVAVIPETFRRTTARREKGRDGVNLEADVLGKVVARLLGRATDGGGVTMDKLREAGW
jgi:riboflavin synthase